MTIIERKSIPEPNSGCWIWLSSVNKEGYGTVRYQGKTRTAHRVSYEIYKGNIPEGICVCHSCDLPGCVNPDHLWLGTIKDNAVDMALKGRTGGQRITKEQAKQIIEMTSTTEASEKFGISLAQASRIRNGRRWAHIRGEN